MSAETLVTPAHPEGPETEAPAKRARLASPDAQDANQDAGQETAIPTKDTTTPLTQEHIFGNLRLRRIVRENHNNTVAQICLMYYRPGDKGLNGHGQGGMPTYERTFDKRGNAIREADDNSNLLGTVGYTQANIYDNENCGDHLDIMSHYQLPPESTKALRTCCWVRSPGDALLAIAGEDTLVHIISLAWTREIRVLRGHAATVVDLQPHPTNNKLLASVSSDQTVRIWSVQTGKCLCVYSHEATAARFHPDGTYLYTGSSSGDIRQWHVPSFAAEPTEPFQYSTDDSTLVVSGKRIPGAAIDCIRFAKSNMLAKNTAGRIDYWDLTTNVLIRSFNIRNHGINVSRFDVSFDDEYICAGNSRGEVYVFGLEAGKAICRLAHKRSVRPVTCCLFSRDGRSVIYAGEGGFLWRYDYVDDETLAEWEKPDESASDDSSAE
ncbi:hypothetical protein GGI07_003603 [Coemansia sp. Benny D115]|nr:hypothetical protein GGI07_003603 [Coemansia sp. Benny D115]